VANGRYVGRCDAAPEPVTTGKTVCSVRLHQAGDRFLYRVGYQQTDAGCFVILRRTPAGRWTILDGEVPGVDVPADLGGPIPSA
jgi:hypothetical protein